eukprot:5708238-Amphidinium_carterae.1
MFETCANSGFPNAMHILQSDKVLTVLLRLAASLTTYDSLMLRLLMLSELSTSLTFALESSMHGWAFGCRRQLH